MKKLQFLPPYARTMKKLQFFAAIHGAHLRKNGDWDDSGTTQDGQSQNWANRRSGSQRGQKRAAAVLMNSQEAQRWTNWNAGNGAGNRWNL